jgi:hypothetical protein
MYVFTHVQDDAKKYVSFQKEGKLKTHAGLNESRPHCIEYARIYLLNDLCGFVDSFHRKYFQF